MARKNSRNKRTNKRTNKLRKNRRGGLFIATAAATDLGLIAYAVWGVGAAAVTALLPAANAPASEAEHVTLIETLMKTNLKKSSINSIMATAAAVLAKGRPAADGGFNDAAAAPLVPGAGL